MAKKKKPDRKKKPAPKKPPPPPPGGMRSLDLPPGITPEMLLDPRFRERLLRQALAEEFGADDTSDPAMERAYALLDQAEEEQDPAKRARLARQALAACPDCADAYVMLADQAKTRRERIELLEQAVAAGERAVGPEMFRDAVGEFWLIMETRPYMRARFDLAQALWSDGRFDDAIGHARELLRLNPNDNQGVRDALAEWLARRERYDELAELLQRYKEDGSAVWAWTQALLAFRAEGDGPAAKKKLKAALKTNKHVAAFLMGVETLPPRMPQSYSPGDKSEAALYAAGFLAAWNAVTGAVEWVTAEAPLPKPKPPRGPSPSALKRIKRLPQTSHVWQADSRVLPVPIQSDEGEGQPWVILIGNRDRDEVLATAISEKSPGFDELWDALAKALQKPGVGRPVRPAALQVLAGGPWEALRANVTELGIRFEPKPELDQLDRAFAGLQQHLEGQPQPGLLEVPGLSPEQVGEFFAAAAEFYRQAPWKSLPTELAARIESPDYPGGAVYAVVMGQSGMTYGLALYRSYDLLRRMWDGDLSEAEQVSETEAVTVTYGTEDELSDSEADALEEHRWPVAGPRAYPSVFVKEKGMVMRPPEAWELELMEAALRALPGFVRANAKGPQTVTVPTAGGPRTLTLSWTEE
jgi:tetratricopeptide (TPR) repeat protein